MIKNIVSNARRFSRWIGVALALTATAASLPANAALVDSKVGIIEYFPGSLLVQMASVNYYAQTATQAGCTTNNQTLDTIKLWQSMAQAALLANKTTRIYFNVCGGANYIAGIDVDQ